MFNGAENSQNDFAWVAEHTEDLNEFFENLYQDVELRLPTTPEEQDFITTNMPNIIRPNPPEMPDAASTAIVSVFLLMSAIIINLFI